MHFYPNDVPDEDEYRAHSLRIDQEGSLSLRLEGPAGQQLVGWECHFLEVRFTPSDLVVESIHPLRFRGNGVAPGKERSQATVLEAISNLLAADPVFYAPQDWFLRNTVLWTA